jgi:hypothetical protein
MATSANQLAVSQNCLHGKPLPKSLEILWAAQERRDAYLADEIRLELLTSVDELNEGYGEAIAGDDADILANVRAHQRVFARLGFFAKDEDGGFYASDLASPAADPPVVWLDSEGQYTWRGIHLAEAVFRLTGVLDRGAEALAWLSEHGLPVDGPRDFGRVEIGATTQFLPSMKDLHKRHYLELLGKPVAIKVAPSEAAAPRDPATWLRRPGAEVREALASLLKLPPGSTFERAWVACDADGRVNTIWFYDTPATHGVAVHGITFGMSRKKAEAALGSPSAKGNGWASFRRAVGRIRIGFENEEVSEIYLGDDDL